MDRHRVLGGARAGAASRGALPDGDVGAQPRRDPARRRTVVGDGAGDHPDVPGGRLGERAAGSADQRQGARTGGREGLRHPRRRSASRLDRRRDDAGLHQHARVASGVGEPGRQGVDAAGRPGRRTGYARGLRGVHPRLRHRQPCGRGDLAHRQPDRSCRDRRRPDRGGRQRPPSDRAGDRRPAVGHPGDHLPQPGDHDAAACHDRGVAADGAGGGRRHLVVHRAGDLEPDDRVPERDDRRCRNGLRRLPDQSLPRLRPARRRLRPRRPAGPGVHRKGDRRVGRDGGHHVPRDGLRQTRRVLHGRRGVGGRHRRGLPRRGDAAARHPGARGQTRMDHPPQRAHRQTLAAPWVCASSEGPQDIWWPAW